MGLWACYTKTIMNLYLVLSRHYDYIADCISLPSDGMLLVAPMNMDLERLTINLSIALGCF